MSRNLVIVTMALGLLAGCNEQRVIYSKCGVGGYTVYWEHEIPSQSRECVYKKDGERDVNCIPCSEAKSKEARWVCFGEKP